MFFVNDLLLFCYGNERNSKKILELLDILCDGISMEMNYNKLACYCYNIGRSLLTTMDTFCPLEKLELGEGLTYLGFYIKPNKYFKHDWFWMINKVE